MLPRLVDFNIIFFCEDGKKETEINGTLRARFFLMLCYAIGMHVKGSIFEEFRGNISRVKARLKQFGPPDLSERPVD